MVAHSDSLVVSPACPELFPQTQWSVISQARCDDDSYARAGLQKLALNYWKPLYLYVRMRGEDHADASDAVQGFFEYVVTTDFFGHVERDGGRFRSYLLKSIENWRRRRRQYAGAQKRGGQSITISLEDAQEVDGILAESTDDLPEAAFDRQWAIELVDRAVNALRESYRKRQRLEWFEALRGALPGGEALPSYGELAKRLDSTEGAIRKAVFDLRNALAARLRAEILETVRDPFDADEELRYLCAVLGK